MSAFAPSSASEPDSAPASGGGSDFRQFAREVTGGQEAFRRIVERHVHAVHSTAERVLGSDAHLAADVTQEVFILLAQKASRLPDDLLLSAWLHRLTVRRALNTARSANRRRLRERRAAEDHVNHMNSHETDAGRATTWNELRPHLDHALLELREADRQAILMRFFEERDLRSIADALGLTVSAAQKRVSRALDLLRARPARRGVTAGVAVLATLLAENPVRAAPLGLSGKIFAASAASLASPASGTTTALFITMSHFKGISLGVVLGLCAGIGWNVLAATPPRGSLENAARAGLPDHGKSAPELMTEARYLLPARASSLTGLFSQMRQILSEPDHELTRQRLLSLIDQVHPGEFKALFEMVRDHCNQAEQERVYAHLTRAWAGIRPEEALATVVTVRSGSLMMETGGNLAKMAFRIWHGMNPENSLQWLTQHSEDEAIGGDAAENMVQEVAKGLIKKSPGAVLDWASRLEGMDYKMAALSVIWQRPGTPASRQEHLENLRSVIGLLNEMPDQAMASKMARICGERMSGDAGVDLEETLRNLEPSEVAWQTALAIAGGTVDRAELALRLSVQRTESLAVSEILRNSFGMSPELLPWALPRLTGPEREATLLEIARQQGQRESGAFDLSDPSSILSLRWAAELSDPAVRDPLIYGLYQKLLTKSPESAAAFAASCGWAKEMKSLLKKAAAEFETVREP